MVVDPSVAWWKSREEGFVYVPLLHTLETLLRDEGIMAEVYVP